MHNWMASQGFLLWHGVGNSIIIIRSLCTKKEEACCNNVALENWNVALHLSYNCRSSKVPTQGPSSLALETFEPMYKKKRVRPNSNFMHLPRFLFAHGACKSEPVFAGRQEN